MVILDGGTSSITVSPYWLITTYFTLTLAELHLSPMGLSFVSKVAPPKIKGLMMGGWFGGPFGMLYTIILWGLAIVGLISIIRGFFSKGRISDNTETQESNAMDILKERYARGEIDKKEFDTKKKNIG